jgi:PPM family protein phosphatase
MDVSILFRCGSTGDLHSLEKDLIPEDNDMDKVEVPARASAKPQPESYSAHTIVDIGACSDPGKIRPNNADSFFVAQFERSMNTLLTNLPAGTVPDHYAESAYGMVVADGIGKTSAGEVASRTAISALIDIVLQTPDWIMHPGTQMLGKVLRRQEQRIEQLPAALIERAKSDPRLSGMGTTMTLAVSLGADLVIAHIGDSRALLFRLGRLLHLTRDQTVAQVLADAGVIRPEDVSKHHARHVLTGAITTQGNKADVELQHVRLVDGDQLLLCSDGLTDMVTDEAIIAALGKEGPASEVSRSLVDLALEAGGEDNVSVVLCRYRIPKN